MSRTSTGATAAARQAGLRSNLQRIADALGVSPESLIESAKSGGYGDETAELVRLWFKITNPDDRRLLLEQVRAAADRAA